MRKLLLFMHVSLDGYFEGPDHDLSWFKTQDEEKAAFTREQLREGDTLLFGHRTYDLMKSYWPTPEAQATDPEVAKFMNDMPKFVVARGPLEPGWKNVTVLSGNVGGEVRRLKELPGKQIVILGSNTLCVSLMEDGLIDEFRILVNPLALGKGTSLFEGLSKAVNLKRTKSREFQSGNILLTYEPRA